MKNRFWGRAFSLGGAFLLSVNAHGQVLGSSARQLSKGALETSFYYQGVSKQHLNFEVTDGGTCSSPNVLTLPAPNFQCGSTADVSGRGSGQAMIFKASYQPQERGLIFYTTVGVGDYRVDVGSVTVMNSSVEDQAGILTSAGAKAVIIPDTVVLAPAVALDASLGLQRYWGTSRLDLFQFQLALEASHKFVFKSTEFVIEPYGGMKYLRTQAYLKNLANGSRVGGRQHTVTPFLGFRVPVFEKDVLFAEVSMVEGVTYASGLSVRF
jgi:hypothetical protein